jgi:hypothetical protein
MSSLGRLSYRERKQWRSVFLQVILFIEYE